MSTSSLQWVVSAYVLGYGGFLLLGGRAADLLGRRRMFLISLGVFVVASGLGALTSDADAADRHAVHQGCQRRLHGSRRALDHHHQLRRGRGPQQGPRDLHRHRRDRLLARPRLQRRADRDRLALGLRLPGADRAAGAVRGDPAGPERRPPRARRLALRRRRRDRRHRGDAAAGLHPGRGAGAGLGVGPHARPGSRRPSRSWSRSSCTSAARRRRWCGSGSCAPASLVRANLAAMALIGGWFGFQFIATLYLQQRARVVGDRDRAGDLPRRPPGGLHRARGWRR